MANHQPVHNICNYKLYTNLSDLSKVYWEIDEDICFRGIPDRYETLTSEGGVCFEVFNVLNRNIVEWYHKNLNKIGFESKLIVENDKYLFYVKYQGKDNYGKMLAILTALRYLQEDNFPKMIEWLYNKTKTTKLDFFTLF